MMVLRSHTWQHITAPVLSHNFGASSFLIHRINTFVDLTLSVGKRIVKIKFFNHSSISFHTLNLVINDFY